MGVAPASALREGHARGPSWRAALQRFVRHRLAIVGAAVLIVLGVTAVFGPLYIPRDLAYRPYPAQLFTPPSPAHPLGTDEVGRDILARLIYAARISLSVGFLSMTMAIGLGTLLGALAGYYGGWVDNAIMRVIEIVLSLPRLFLLIVLAALLGPSMRTLILVIGGLSWMEPCRIIRASVLSVREREFVLAARALGASSTSVIRKHILPNVIAPIVVGGTLGVGEALLLEATVSYLGLGVQPPDPSWGNMLYNAQQYLQQAPYAAIFPGLMILITVLSVNFIGDALRDTLDPELKGAMGRSKDL